MEPPVPSNRKIECLSCHGDTFTIYLETSSITLVCATCRAPMTIQSLLGALDKKIISGIIQGFLFRR